MDEPCYMCGRASVVNINGNDTCREHVQSAVAVAVQVGGMQMGWDPYDVDRFLIILFEDLNEL